MATDQTSLARLFGGEAGLLPLWIAEPYIELAPEVTAVLQARANVGWFGYETRPAEVMEAFWAWMASRHGWSESGLRTSVSPSVGFGTCAVDTVVSVQGDLGRHPANGGSEGRPASCRFDQRPETLADGIGT